MVDGLTVVDGRVPRAALRSALGYLVIAPSGREDRYSRRITSRRIADRRIAVRFSRHDVDTFSARIVTPRRGTTCQPRAERSAALG